MALTPLSRKQSAKYFTLFFSVSVSAECKIKQLLAEGMPETATTLCMIFFLL
jgi:hypothetical protein